jgi:hypothetical protein
VTLARAAMLALFLGLVVGPRSAQAQEDACTRSYTENQRLRKQGKLKAAREQLLACVSPTCPAMVQTDCANWLTQLDQQLPSIIIAATGPDGREVANVAVRDGTALIAGSLDGRPIVLDPGQHDLEFLFAGVPAVKQSIVVREGEQNRRISVSFAPVWTPPPRAIAPERGYELSIAGAVVGGLGIASIAAFVGLGVSGQSEFDELRETCGAGAPPADRFTCPENDIDPVELKLTAADVLLGVGAGLTAIGLTLVIIDLTTAPESGTLQASVGLGHAEISLRF